MSVRSITDSTINLLRSLSSPWWDYNGVAVQVPWVLDRTGDRPDHEADLVAAIQTAVSAGDRVTLVGCGSGCSTVHASQQAGADGRVIAYEGSIRWASCARATLRTARNETPADTELRQAIVGPEVDVWATPTDRHVDPAALPAADTLVLDCEGAEREILAAYLPEHAPRDVVVEVHEVVEVRDVLTAHGYACGHRADGDGATTVERWGR